MNKKFLTLVLLTIATSVYTANTSKEEVPTVTLHNNTTGNLDIYQGQERIIKKLPPSETTTVPSTTLLSIQASSAHSFISPVFIDPSDLQTKRQFMLSSSRNGFVLEQVHG